MTFLIPVITPGYFKSKACRDELERFLDRETQLGRTDLVLPIYYVKVSWLDEKDKVTADPLAKAILDHQYVDWRDHRFESIDSPPVKKIIAELA